MRKQMRIIISDRNRKETSLKSELHSAQILLSSTVDHYKSKTEEVTLLKKNFKQKEDKFLEEFLDLKKLKDKIEDRLYKQDQSVQTVYMLVNQIIVMMKALRKSMIVTSFFKIKNLEHQIKEKDNVILHLKDLVASVNDRSREPYNAVDVTALIEQNDCDKVELEKSLKLNCESKRSLVSSDYVKPKGPLLPGMLCLLSVKTIPHPLKNNRSAHLNYISHLKESVETVREIVKEARVVKPLDSSLNFACDNH
ncbi:hypothetical protein Tco_0775184 [Tanacetum coccineum]